MYFVLSLIFTIAKKYSISTACAQNEQTNFILQNDGQTSRARCHVAIYANHNTDLYLP
jgi:hypothetical protein